jgi:hypothetical protein
MRRDEGYQRSQGGTIMKSANQVSLVSAIDTRAATASIRKLAIVAIILCALAGVTKSQSPTRTPTIQGVSLREIAFTNKVVAFTIEISGADFGANPTDLTVVQLEDPKGSNVGTLKSKTLSSNNRIVAQFEAPLGSTISRIKVTIKGVSIETSDFKLSLKEPAPPPTITPFEIKHSTLSSPNSPFQTLSITNEKGLFASNPHRMNVEILPAGASNIFIRPGSNPYNLIVDFMAPEKFEVKDVVVTVYDSSDLDARRPNAISQPFKEKKPPSDPNQPVITKTEVVFLQRNRGIGRVKIEGSGFGNYRRPTMSAEDFLATYGMRSVLPSEQNPTSTPSPAPTPPQDWRDWNEDVERAVNVVLVPRNPSLRVERSEILYIDDKLIDLYFQFSRFGGYSMSFRPASVSLTVTKPGAKQIQLLKAEGVIATLEGPETYLVSKEIGTKRDENLTYEFTVLDNNKANYEFGNGIAENFYVVKLSVVNRGEKKIAIPLASIQAEIDWAHGQLRTGSLNGQPVYDPNVEFFEGPETQTPVPLEDVSAFFDSYQKQHGKRAKLFNTLSGLTTLGASLIPFFGPGFKDAHVAFTGGLIPGLRQGIGDLSGQQLQNLTARTWQNIEVLADRGGSVTKYIFVQRGEQVFTGTVKPNLRKQIMNLRGIEVTGFEVIESSAKQAVQQ